jgi:hypothetical protein
MVVRTAMLLRRLRIDTPMAGTSRAAGTLGVVESTKEASD